MVLEKLHLEKIYIILGSHFSQSEEAEVGGILQEVRMKPLHIVLLF